MAVIEDLEPGRPLYLRPVYHDSGDSSFKDCYPGVRADSRVDPAVIEAPAVSIFLDWFKADPRRRALFEADLQSIAEDHKGERLLTTWVGPTHWQSILQDRILVLEPPRVRAVLRPLQEAIRAWPDDQETEIEITGYARVP